MPSTHVRHVAVISAFQSIAPFISCIFFLFSMRTKNNRKKQIKIQKDYLQAYI